MMVQKDPDDRMSDSFTVIIKPGPEALLNNIMALILICHSPMFLKHRLNGFFYLKHDIYPIFPRICLMV